MTARQAGTRATEESLREALGALTRLDPTLLRIAEIAGPLPLRLSPGGFRGLAGVIAGQQVSRASAAAMLLRLQNEIDLDDPAAILAAADEAFRRAGFSRSKQRSLAAVAQALAAGMLDFERIAAASADEAIAELVAIPGIGPWTAQCYLLFSAGHPDVFPAGDLALQIAVGHALADGERQRERALIRRAETWGPYRSVAARLFWAYYAVLTRREAAPVALGGVAGRSA